MALRLFRRPKPTPAWARQVVATIPRDDLACSIVTFAEQATKDGGEKRAMHLAKLRAACERVEEALRQQSP